MIWKCGQCGRVTSQPDTAEQVWCLNIVHNPRLMQPVVEDDD